MIETCLNLLIKFEEGPSEGWVPLMTTLALLLFSTGFPLFWLQSATISTLFLRFLILCKSRQTHLWEGERRQKKQSPFDYNMEGENVEPGAKQKKEIKMTQIFKTFSDVSTEKLKAENPGVDLTMKSYPQKLLRQQPTLSTDHETPLQLGTLFWNLFGELQRCASV